MLSENSLLAHNQRNFTALTKPLIFSFNFAVVFFFGLLCAVVISLVFNSFFVGICELMGVIMVALFSIKISRRDIPSLLLCKIIGIVFIIAVYYGNIHLFGSPYFSGGSDDLKFELMGQLFLRNGIDWPWEYIYSNNARGMYWLMSLFIKLGSLFDGYHTLGFRFFNMNLHLICGELVYLIFRTTQCNNPVTLKKLFLFFLLFPNALYISSFIFRDTIVVLLMLLSYALSDDIFKKYDTICLIDNRFIAIIFLVCLLFIGYYFRVELFAIILLIFAVSYADTNKLNLKTAFLFLFAFIVLVGVLDYMNLVDYFYDKAEYYGELRAAVHRSDYNSISAAIFQMQMLPYGIIARSLYGLMVPMPTNIINFTKIFNSELDFILYLVNIGTCVQIILLPSLFCGLKRIDKLSIVFLAVFMSIVVSTFTFRHFLMIYPFMFMIMFRQLSSASKVSNIKNIIRGLIYILILFILFLIVK